MRLQILSDLHLETEPYEPEPADDAEALVLAGDIDSTWAGLDLFRGWPVPVLFVPGNHEFDGRSLNEAGPALRQHCEALGFVWLERTEHVMRDRQGRLVRFLGTVRWTDFDLFGPARRERVMRAGSYFARVMQATRDGLPFDAPAIRQEGLACRGWLEAALADHGSDVDATVVVTHFGPSLRSADPRYGAQPGTASFCNADDDLLPLADLWIHGHLHCRHDYEATAHGRRCRVVSNARGHRSRGETEGHDPRYTVEV